MLRPIIAFTAFAAALVGWQDKNNEPALLLKEESLTLEYTASNGEATVVVAAESEIPLGSVQLESPEGAPMLKMRAPEGQRLAMQGFVVETFEGSADELMGKFHPGRYELFGRAVDGRATRGSAVLSHDLLLAPVITYPQEGSVGVSQELLVTWVADPNAVAYTVQLEQGDSDGLSATLPAGSSSFQVSPGVLLPNTETQVEVGAIGDNGNCTLYEIEFTTL